MAGGPHPALHALEREIMDEVWRRGAVTVREVLTALNERGSRERAYTTVLTVLGRLEGKGLVTRKRRGRADVFQAAVSRESWVQARASADVERLLGEYGETALAHFARRVEGLDPERRRQLRRLVDD